MSSSVAFVVLAHNDPVKVRRLLGTLDGADVFLHCDRRTSPEVVAGMLPAQQPGIRMLDRIASRRGSWSLVDVELRGLRAALEHSRAEHIVVMSGACYPLMSLEELEAELSGWPGQSLLELNAIPYPGWSRRWNSDGGMWRFTHWVATVNDNALAVRDIPLVLGRHAVPAGLNLHGSAHWKIYSRRHAEAVLRVLDDHPEQVRYWRHTYIPEEACIASVLMSPAFVGDLSASVRDYLPWYIRWTPPTHHPVSLTEDDFDALALARSGLVEPRNGAGPGAVASSARSFFARKIGSDAAGLLDRIDRELRGQEAHLPPAAS